MVKNILILCSKCDGKMIWSDFSFYEDPTTVYEGWYCKSCGHCVAMWEADPDLKDP